MNTNLTLRYALLFICALPMTTNAATNEVRTLNTPRTFPPIFSKAQWQSRAKEIREQALVSCGLWPLPQKTPLNAQIFGRIEREDYTVEKVHFQSWPGFYVCGNLYRPRGKGNGPFPAVLNPHGHWANGRLIDTKDCSVAARCINFAKQGLVAFSYDMVGYNDTFFANEPREGQPGSEFYKRHRLFATTPACQLWGISLMGLQVWNAIRGVDFLESLPDVDKHRLACTGASGGGTQTFMLGAIDDRLAAQAPCVMVSHTMQGGCSCENAPGLRIEYSNMEIAAAAAPRPQLLVAATGDWTKMTLTVEGPAVESIYRLFDATDRLRYVRFDFGHNYNQTSREAVYAWFDRWLLGKPDAPSLAEPPYQKEPDKDLRVFPDEKLPADAVGDEQLITRLIAQQRERVAALTPHNRKSHETFKKTMLPFWRHTLQLDWPANNARIAFKPLRREDGFTATDLDIRRDGDTGTLSAAFFKSGGAGKADKQPRRVIVLVNADGPSAYCDAARNPLGLAKALLEKGDGVVVVTEFAATPTADPFKDFYTTYNRTLLQERVRDLVTLCSNVRALSRGKATSAKVILCGEGRAGLWALLAAPAADAVVADCAAVKTSDDQTFLAQDLFCPSLRAMGGFETAALLATPHPLFLHNTGSDFATDFVGKGYRALSRSRNLRLEVSPLDQAALLRWLRSL
jgi:dienelactone hydrolase